MKQLLWLLLIGACVAQQGYAAYTGTDYVALPGCTTTCTAPVVPKAGPSCSAASFSWTSVGCTAGVGYSITGDNAAYGSHPLIRLTDATVNASKSFNNASQGNIPHINADTTLMVVQNNFGSLYLQGFNPATKTVAAFSTTPQFSGSLAFSHTNPAFLYIVDHVDSSSFVETTAPEIDKLTIGHLVSSTCTAGTTGGTPCILSATKLFNFVTDSAKCLDTRYNSYAWNGSFAVDAVDSSFTLGFALGAQNTGSVVVNYTVGSGARCYHTDTRIMTGDWGTLSCATGTASCFDGTATQTSAYVAKDWFHSKAYTITTSVIAPDLNNTAHCTFTAQSTGTSGVTASEPNWDAQDGGSCASAAVITDNTTSWKASGVNPGVCGTGCTPVTETDRFYTHEVIQRLDSSVSSVSTTPLSSACLQDASNCQNAQLGSYVWYPISSLSVNSCYELQLAATPDYQNNTAYALTGPQGIVPINPRTNNPGPYFFKVVQAGTSLPSSAPDWSLHQGGAAFFDDGCVSNCAGHLKWAPFLASNECSGHAAAGYLREYIGSTLTSNPWRNYGTYIQQTALALSALSGGTDFHGTYNNADANDTNPLFAVFVNVDNPTTGSWFNTSNFSYWNELVAMFPSATPNGATFLRYGHTFNSGSNPNFNIQNAVANVSPDGNWILFSSDWEGTLGSEGGSSSCTIDGVAGSTACRADVFLMQLRTNSVAPASMFAERNNEAHRLASLTF